MKNIKHFIFVFLFLVVFNSCGDAKKDKGVVYKVANKLNFDLVKIDSLRYKNTNSKYIGRIKDIEIWDNYILITDIAFNKIWIFNKELNLIKTFGKKGNGPGEFSSAPLLILKKEQIVLYDFKNYRATIIDSAFELKRTINLKHDKIIRRISPIYINGKYIFAGGGTSSRLENLFESGSLVVLDDNFKYQVEILEYHEDYKKRNAFIVYNDKTYLTQVNDSSFLALQSAARTIFCLNNNLEVEKTIEFLPEHYKIPPEDDIHAVSRSIETMGEYFSKITNIKKIDYDESSECIFIYYVNYYKEMVTERNWFKGDHYLLVLDKDYNSILDQKINGIFSFVENGNIYILTEENPKGIKIDVFKLLKSKNE